MRKNNHHSIPTTEVKSRVKMWRSGKNWVYGLLFFFGMAGISFGQANLVHADTTALNAETQKGTIASQLTDRAVPLQTSSSKSADDSTTTATSDTEPDISGTNAEQTDKTVEPSTAEATGSDTTDTTAPAADSESTTAGEQTKSATTESPVSDPVSLSTTDSTDTTGATDQADSSPATKSDVAPVKEQTDTDTAGSSETAIPSDTTTTTSPDETANTETPTTDQTESSASSETSTTSETSISDTSTESDTENSPSMVDTSNTPLPEVGYKSMLSAEQAATLAGTSEVSSGTENTSDPATTNGSADQTTTSNNGLPDGFSVTDPDYPAGAFHHTVDDGSGLYSFFEGANGTNKIVLSANRSDVTEIHLETLSTDGTTVTNDQIITDPGKYTAAGFTVKVDGETIDSIYVSGPKYQIVYDVDAYPKGSATTWDGFATLKPMEQSQTTSYVDDKGTEIADSVTMTGLSGQKYTTNSAASLSGYEPTKSDNATGVMSQFQHNGQTFDEEIYSSGVDVGTLTYTVKDVDVGTMSVSFKSKVNNRYLTGSTTLTYTKGQTIADKTGTNIFGIGYNVPNIYLPQTTAITYTYDASVLSLNVSFVDENGNEIKPALTQSATYKETTNIDHPDITGYTYDTSYTSTANDNPDTYVLTDLGADNDITLHYTANPESVTVEHVDATRKPIGTDTTLKGKFGQSITIDATTDKDHWNIQGYKATDDSVSYTFIDGVQTVEVPYTQVFTAPIHYVDNSGNAIDSSLLTGAPQMLSGDKDENVEFTSPVIPGYTAFPDNPTSYTLSDNDTKGVTLRYVPTTVDITWETPAGSDTPVLTSNAGIPVAGQPISADDPTGPKWPTSLTTPGLDNPTDAFNSDGLIRTIEEVVYQYPSTTTDPTELVPSRLYAYFNRTATIDFSNPSAPSVKFGDWHAFEGPKNTTIKETLGSDYYPAADYIKAVDLVKTFNPTTQIAKAFDAKGNPVDLADIDVFGQSLYGLPARQVTADSPSTSTYYIIFYTLNDLQRTYTRTVNFVDENNQLIAGAAPIVQTVTATREPVLDLTNPSMARTTGYSDWTLSANEFTAVPATAIPGYLAPSSGIDALAINVDTTPSSTTATLTYTPITGTYKITTPEGNVTENHWTTDPDDPSKLAKVTVPTIENYTPVLDDGTPLDKDPNTGDYIIPAPTAPNTFVNITYREDTSSVTVDFTDYTDSSNAPWPSQTFSGEPGKPVKYSQDKNGKPLNKYREGYLLLFDGTLDAPVYGSEAQTVNMGYMPVKGNYEITPINGGDPEVKPFAVDPKTPTQYLQQTIPVVEGYTAVIDHGDNAPGDIEVDPDDPTQYLLPTPTDTLNDVTIKYIADQQQLTVHFKMPAGVTAPADVNLTGESGSDVVYTDVIKSIADYVYVPSESDIVDKFDYDSSTLQTTTLVYKAVGDYTYTTPGTDTPTTTTYTTDQDNPSVATGTVPYIDGYTPTSTSGNLTPIKDADGKVTSYTFTPTNPTQPAEIKYDAKKQNLTVYFETADEAEILGKVTLTGVSGGPVDYSTVNKQRTGFILKTDGTLSTTKYDTDDDQDQSVILTYAALGDGVTVTTPTGEKTTTPYTNDSTEPKDPKAVDPITISYVPGYTPSSDNGDVTPVKDPEGNITGYTLIPTYPTKATRVTYDADAKNFDVAFVDESDPNTALKPTQNLNGVTDGDIDYTTVEKVIDGYVLVTDPTEGKTKFAATDNGETLTLVYNQIGNGVTLTTPDQDNPDGQQTTKTYTNDPEDPSTVLPIDVPYIAGYTPSTPETVGKVEPKDPDDLTKGYTFTPSNPSQPATVAYSADRKSIKVAFINDADKQEIAGHPAIELPGVTDGIIDYTTINKLIDGYVLVNDGTKGKTTFAANDDDTPFTILYKEIGTGLTLTTPDPDNPDGQQTTKPYTNDPEDPSTVLPIDVPYIPGYTPTTPETVGTVEPKDPANPSKGYTFTPKDPAQPATVTYNADSKNFNVVFVDQADPEPPLKLTQNLSGVTDGDVDYTTVEKVINGYVLLTDETVGKTKFAASDNGEDLTLTYQKTDGGYVGKTPAGVDLTTPYVTDPEDPKAVQPITIPTVPGYTLDTENGKRTPIDDNDPSKGYTVTPIDPSKPTTVTYTPETGKSVQVAYVDENGVEIAGHPVKTISGQTDQTIDYGTKAIAGYFLTSDDTIGKTTFAADDDGTPLAISYEKIVVTITKPTDDGNTETVPVDTTTPGHVDYIPGYTPKTDDGTALTPVDPEDKTKGYTVPVPDDPTTKTTINYDPDMQTAQVILIDTAGNPVTNDEGQSTYTFHGVTGQGIHEWEVDKKAAAYTISEDGTLKQFVYDNVDGNVQVVKVIYLKTTAFNDPDGGTTTLLTDGSGKVVSIDKKWGTDGGDTNVLIENGTTTLTPNPDGTPITLNTGVPDGDGPVTGTLGDDGTIILTQKTPDGTVTETITPDGQLSFSQVPAAVSPTPEAFFNTQTTHDPDGGTTTTKTNGNGAITAIDRNWPDGDHSHVDIDIDTGIATITETPNGGSPSEPVAIQPGTTATVGKTTLDNHDPINLTHAGTDGDSTIATITPDGKRTFTYSHTTDDPDGGKTTTTTNTNGKITTIDKDWGDGDHSHIDIDTGTGIATITETPAGGSPSEPVTVQTGESGKNGKTTLDNGEPDGNIVLTHQGTDGDKTIETITPDTSRSFSRQPAGVQTTKKDYFETQITHDPDGGTTATKTNGEGDITTIDKDWDDGDHTHVDIDTDTGIATITETPAGGNPSEPMTVQPGESGKNGKTTLDNSDPDGNIVLTHQGTDGDKTTETITPDTSRSFSRQPGGVSTTSKDYFETQITHDPDGGTTTTKTNGDGDITSIDKDWSDGDHSHVDIDTDTGIATITETPNGGEAGTPVEVQPGESGENGKTTFDNGEPDGNIVLTHQGTDGDKTTETITPDTSRSFSRQPGGVSTTSKDYFETQITHDPDGGTTTTKTNGDGDITSIDKDWSDGDHSHVDIDTDTGIATITETPNGGEAGTPVEVQPGESGENGKTTLDNGEPDGNIVLTHQGTDGDKTTETITPDTSRSFSRQPGGVSTDASHYFETQITHDPDGGTTTTKTNGDGDITTIDKDWGDGDHSHVDIDTDTGIATITETPNGGEAGTPVEVQPGESGKNGKTTFDNGEPDGNIVLIHQGTDGDKTTETITPDTSRSFSRQPGGVSTDASHYYETQITHDPDGGTTTTKTNGDGDITTIDKDWSDGDHSHIDIDTDTGIATITETPNGGETGTPVEVQPGESGKNGKTTLDNGEPDGNIVLTHQGTDGDKTTETITPDTSRSFSRQPGGVSTDASHYFETQITHDPDGDTTTTKTNGDGDITTIDKDWGDGDHSHVDIDTDTGIATITETPDGGEPRTPVEVQPGESGKNGKTTLDNGEPDGNIVLTHQGTDGDKTIETITPDTSRSFSRQPGGVSTDASHYYTTQVTHDPDGGTTTTRTNGDGDITTIDKDWGDGDHSHVDINTDTGIATITETPNGGEAGTPVEVQPGESGKNGKTTLDNGKPDGNIVLTHQGTDGDKTTETITPDTSRSFSRQPGGVSTTVNNYYTTQVTHDPDGGTTTTKTNGDGDITTIDKDWGDGDHSHVDIDTDTGIATITETPNGGEAGTPVEVQPGESGKNGKTTLDNGEPDGNIVLTHQGTDGDKTTETITPDTTRSFSRMPAPVFVTADDYYDTRITHDADGGTTTTVTNGNGDVTTIDKDWGDGSHTHVTVDPNTGDVTATDTDENGNTSTPVTVKPGETGTTGQTTITNGRPDGDIILSHEGTDGDQVEATISDDGHVRVSLPDTDAEAKAETNVTVTSTSGSTTSANHANLSQTSATSRTDVQGKKPSTTQLPETGDKQNGLGLIGATLLAGLAMLGLGKRRRDDED